MLILLEAMINLGVIMQYMTVISSAVHKPTLPRPLGGLQD